MASTDQAPQKIKTVLKQIFGEKINEEYNLTGSVVSIGRSPRCQIQLSSVNVSRKHCILTCSNDDWTIMDNKSRNGTYINGRMLQPEEKVLLQYGDIVFLGPPSEMPQAFSFEEIFQNDEDMETDDDDIIELPTKPSCDQDIEIITQKAPKSSVQNCSIEILDNVCHSKDPSKAKKALETVGMSNDITSTNEDFYSLPSTNKFKDCTDEISEISFTGSDHGGNSASLLTHGTSSLGLLIGFPDPITDPVPSYYPEEHREYDSHRKRKRESSKKDKDLESKLALLTEQIKVLKESKLELLKNYEDACEKNKVLDQQLAEKQKKLEEDLQEHEVKAKNEVKSELLEKLEEDLICNICTELFIKPTVLDCSHTFCEYCIKEWRKKKNDCPICRCKIKNTTRVRTLEEFIDKTLTTLTPEQRVKRDSIVAERQMAEQPPKPAHTPKRRRHGRVRQQRHARSSTITVSNSNVHILEDPVNSRHSRASRLNPLNLPRDELNLRVNLPVELPVLRFFFS